ncbi:MAG: hypothetical protein KU38_12985 [Sulfurovum sp. FS08-3]|nr:MAG: hypothetical protein KU38_12985 [Sulfurovum sp. FS08-3]
MDHFKTLDQILVSLFETTAREQCKQSNDNNKKKLKKCINIKNKMRKNNMNNNKNKLLIAPREISDCLPEPIQKIVKQIGEVVQASEDVIAVNALSVLASLSGSTMLLNDKNDTQGLAIILYTAFFTKSGGGKTGVQRKLQTYLLDWLEKIYAHRQKKQDERKNMLEKRLKSKNFDDEYSKASIIEELFNMKPYPDLFLEDATPEGFEQSILAGSSPLLYIDNFGQYLSSASKNENKAGLLRSLDNIFDSGKMTTRRLKGEAKRATKLSIKNFGLHLTSTIGASNLKPQDIVSSIENGFLNKVIITFQDSMEKDIPLQNHLDSYERDTIQEFAESYFEYARTSLFYLSDEALEVYYQFHTEISELYKEKYNNDEDLAGYVIRQLNISKRIATIFEIATQCIDTTFDGKVEPLDTEKRQRQRVPVSESSMLLAIQFLRYIQREHLEKLVLYGKSKNGKLSIEDTIYLKAKKIIDQGNQLHPRILHQSLSKAQRKKVGGVDDLRIILHRLLSEGKLELKDIDAF